jgi:hypothetical protein
MGEVKNVREDRDIVQIVRRMAQRGKSLKHYDMQEKDVNLDSIQDLTTSNIRLGWTING